MLYKILFGFVHIDPASYFILTEQTRPSVQITRNSLTNRDIDLCNSLPVKPNAPQVFITQMMTQQFSFRLDDVWCCLVISILKRRSFQVWTHMRLRVPCCCRRVLIVLYCTPVSLFVYATNISPSQPNNAAVIFPAFLKTLSIFNGSRFPNREVFGGFAWFFKWLSVIKVERGWGHRTLNEVCSGKQAARVLTYNTFYKSPQD